MDKINTIASIPKITEMEITMDSLKYSEIIIFIPTNASIAAKPGFK